MYNSKPKQKKLIKKKVEKEDNKSIWLREIDWKWIMASNKIEEVHLFIDAIVNKKLAHLLNEKETLLLKEKRNVKLDITYRNKKAEEFRADLIREQTPSEVKFKAILKSMGIPYEFQKILYTAQTFYIIDFYLPDYKIAIEIDGGYHLTDNQRMKDTIRTRVLNGQLKKVYRISNECVESVELTVRKVKEFIGKK